jgi:hypothetical protein
MEIADKRLEQSIKLDTFDASCNLKLITDSRMRKPPEPVNKTGAAFESQA